jgi:hypothetical protein
MRMLSVTPAASVAVESVISEQTAPVTSAGGQAHAQEPKPVVPVAELGHGAIMNPLAFARGIRPLRRSFWEPAAPRRIAKSRNIGRANGAFGNRAAGIAPCFQSKWC